MGGCIICHSPGHEEPYGCNCQPGWGLSFLTINKTTDQHPALKTEAEEVGVNEAMYLVIWTRLFLEGQGFEVIENIVNQDNQSVMLLVQNGKMSSSKNTHHIKIRYYFITDHIAQGKMSLAYFPTDTMVADYFTKPLKDTKFQNLCAMITNHHDPALVLMSQECVEALPMATNLEEKDLLDSGSANSMKETSSLVHGGGNTKELPDKTNLMGWSKECAVNSRRPKNDVAIKGCTHRWFKHGPTVGSYSQGLTLCG